MRFLTTVTTVAALSIGAAARAAGSGDTEPPVKSETTGSGTNGQAGRRRVEAPRAAAPAMAAELEELRRPAAPAEKSAGWLAAPEPLLLARAIDFVAPSASSSRRPPRPRGVRGLRILPMARAASPRGASAGSIWSAGRTGAPRLS